jgi:hypothetical protein
MKNTNTNTLIDYYLLQIVKNKHDHKKVKAYRTLLSEAIKMKLNNDGDRNTYRI